MVKQIVRKSTTQRIQSTLEKVRVARSTVEMSKLELKTWQQKADPQNLEILINNQKAIIESAQEKIVELQTEHISAHAKIVEIQKIISYKERQLRHLECDKTIKRLLQMRDELNILIKEKQDENNKA